MRSCVCSPRDLSILGVFHPHTVTRSVIPPPFPSLVRLPTTPDHSPASSSRRPSLLTAPSRQHAVRVFLRASQVDDTGHRRDSPDTSTRTTGPSDSACLALHCVANVPTLVNEVDFSKRRRCQTSTARHQWRYCGRGTRKVCLLCGTPPCPSYRQLGGGVEAPYP